MSNETKVKERPILFSSPMVRAILEGRKTQTRRIIKPQPSPCGLRKLTGGDITATGLDASYWYGSDPFTEARQCPYGVPGDRLWVRETWGPSDGGFCYRASERPTVKPDDGKWHPAIHMFRFASRITLEIEAVRVERLQEIGEEDAVAEGIVAPRCEHCGYTRADARLQMDHRFCQTSEPPSAVPAYLELWESINGAGSWDANPWVWVIQFRRGQP